MCDTSNGNVSEHKPASVAPPFVLASYCEWIAAAASDAPQGDAVERLNRIPGVRCPRPDGAFYAFPDVRAVTHDTKALAERLLYEEKVVVSPGEAFGPRSAGFLRLSYASSDGALTEGLDRLAVGLAKTRGA